MEATRAHPSVESIREVIAYLVIERQSLRAHGAQRPELEANRQALVALQWRLNRALAAEHGPRDGTAVRLAS